MKRKIKEQETKVLGVPKKCLAPSFLALANAELHRLSQKLLE